MTEFSLVCGDLHVDFEFDPEDLELPAEEFVERFLLPAYVVMQKRMNVRESRH